jgi:hypothetical protein
MRFTADATEAPGIKSSAKDLSLPIFEIAMDQKAHMK